MTTLKKITYSNSNPDLKRLGRKLFSTVIRPSADGEASFDSSPDTLQYFGRKRQTNVSLRALMETGKV
jgi:hypothetical protein